MNHVHVPRYLHGAVGNRAAGTVAGRDNLTCHQHKQQPLMLSAGDPQERSKTRSTTVPEPRRQSKVDLKAKAFSSPKSVRAGGV